MRSDRKGSRVIQDLVGEDRRSRRAFLRNTAMAAGTSTAILAGASTGLAADGVGVTNPPLPYQADPYWIQAHFQNIINNETNHLSSLQNELGTNARPAPSFTNLTATSVQQFVQMGSMFCALGAGAYLGASPYISNPYLLNQAGAIGQVELTQSGYLNTLLDLPFTAGGSPYGFTLTLQQVLDALAPYVTSLNGGPSPVFSTTDLGLENDIAIFNLAIILEYLEVQFYTTNFATFFPGAASS